MVGSRIPTLTRSNTTTLDNLEDRNSGPRRWRGRMVGTVGDDLPHVASLPAVCTYHNMNSMLLTINDTCIYIYK